MIDTSYRRVELLDSVEEYRNSLRGRRMRLWGMMLICLFIVAGVIVTIRFLAPEATAFSPIVALAILLLIAIPVMVWNNPRAGLYILAISACLFIQSPGRLGRDPFEYVPIYWSGNVIAENYAGGLKALDAINFNYAEVVMVMTALFWIMRKVTLRELKFDFGAFFPWLALFLAWSVVGLIRGTSAGGYFVTALWEMRAQAYFIFAYLLATNLVTDRKHVMALLWIMAIGIGLKSFVGTANWIKNPGVTADEGVLAHEDSMLLNIVLFGAVIFTLARLEPKLKWVFILLVPTALAASFANGRRAGIAAFIVAFPIVVAMLAVLLKERRKALIQFLALFVLASAIYLPVAWNATGAWALPARAIKSRTSPDARDAGSDYYRLAEKNNLKLTRDVSPWFGYGYGRPYILAYKQWGRNDPFMNILPHNGILWIWMRLGHVGFLFFWMFVANVLIKGPNLLKSVRDPRLQAIGILSIAIFMMMIIYGEYDLTFANYRVMWLAGTMLGVLAALPRLDKAQEEVLAAERLAAGEGPPPDEEDTEEEETQIPPSGFPWQKQIPGWSRGADW
jgi:hypothetical protein